MADETVKELQDIKDQFNDGLISSSEAMMKIADVLERNGQSLDKWRQADGSMGAVVLNLLSAEGA